MAKKITLFALLLLANIAFGQNFLNGDFEVNTAVIDRINLANAVFNGYMPNNNGFGPGGNLDIITTSTWTGGPQNGSWFIAMTGGGTDIISLKFNTPLISGHTYTISYYDKRDSIHLVLPLDFGLSTTNNHFGTLVHTATGTVLIGTWTQRTFTFVAPNNGQYLTIMPQGSGGTWVHLDNFKLVCTSNLNLGNDTAVCQGESVNLNAGTAFSYLWSNGSTTPSINVSSTGNYWVQTSNGMCSTSDTVHINVNPFPNPGLGNDTTLCQGQSITLSAGAASNYLWSTGATTSSISSTLAGTYWVQASNGRCSTADSITIAINSYPSPELGNDTTLCEGETITLHGGPASSYLWSNSATAASLTVNSSGIYWLQASNGNCKTSDTTHITILPYPVVTLGNDTTLCQGQTLAMDAGIAENYLWSNGSTQRYTPATLPGTYSVQTANGPCVSNDQISVQFVNCEIELEFPTVFTPNNDGLNDVFHPIVMKGITRYDLRIYNRWGVTLFSTEDLTAGWDGSYQNNTCSDGTYFWEVVYSTISNETKVQKGFLLLSR